MTKRAEFSKATKREALKRAGNGDAGNARCEATGDVYGMGPQQRCFVPLAQGVEFDHYPVRAADGGSNDLSNCVAVCPEHHGHKTRTFDTPQAAKGKRVSDKHVGIKSKPSSLSTDRRQKRATTPVAGKFPGDIMGRFNEAAE